MAVIYSELLEDYFLTNIKDDLFKDTDEADEDDDSMTSFPITEFSLSGCPVSSLRIEHSRSSSVDLVGLQVWRGALLLADFLLADPALVAGSRVLELAAGTGITSLTAAMFARSVTATDVDRGDILNLLNRNHKLNEEALQSCDFKVAELDFFWEEWQTETLQICENCDVILAADVVYDKNITLHFFKTLKKILAISPKTALIAIEKRQHAGSDGVIVAPNYDIFLDQLSQLDNSLIGENTNVSVANVPINFQQFFKYSRVNELNLFKIISYRK